MKLPAPMDVRALAGKLWPWFLCYRFSVAKKAIGSNNRNGFGLRRWLAAPYHHDSKHECSRAMLQIMKLFQSQTGHDVSVDSGHNAFKSYYYPLVIHIYI